MNDMALTGETRLDSQSRRRSLRSKKSLAILGVSLPAIIFYSVLFNQAVNLPDLDDYWALLDFMNRMEMIQGISAKLSYFWAAQYYEYKLFFEHALIWAQVTLLGHVDFRLLCAIGNGLVLLLGMLLWKLFLPKEKDIPARLILFIPVSWLLFQFQYIEFLDWAMCSLENVPVLVFSFGAIFLLFRKSHAAYFGALVCLILAIASFGNGMLLVPIGLLMLVMSRSYTRMLVWGAVSAGCITAYAYHYAISLAAGPIHFSISSILIDRPLYFLIFLGSAAAFPLRGGYVAAGLLLCPLLGTFICIFFIITLRRGYFRRNPLIGYCVLFLFATAGIVSVGRAEGGILSAYSSRYGIYSALLLIFAWFVMVEEFLPLKSEASRKAAIRDVIKIVVLFSLMMDLIGWRYTVDRNRELVRGMKAFERCSSSAACVGPVLPVPRPHAWMIQLEQESPSILEQSIKLGIYKAPKL